MSAKRPSAKPSDAYHHGDLRSALIAAAREALETTPPDQVTLKSLATRLGVSQPAPYRHFANRDALLAAVAADGFVRFRAALIASTEDAPPNEAFEQSSLAYLEFGRRNMGVYRLMFASKIPATADDEALEQAGTAAFNILLESVEPHVPPGQAPVIAIWIWSTLHGLVMLEAEGLNGGPLHSVSPADVVRQMARVFRQG